MGGGGWCIDVSVTYQNVPPPMCVPALTQSTKHAFQLQKMEKMKWWTIEVIR